MKKYKSDIYYCLLVGLVILFCFSLDFREWLSYNLYHRPLYALFFWSPIKAYWVNSITYIFILIAFLGFVYMLYSFVIRDRIKSEYGSLNKIVQITVLCLLFALVYYFYSSIIKDTFLLYKNKYSIVDVNITDVKKLSRKGSNIYCINYLSLDVYQYKELQKKKEKYNVKKIDLDRIKLKVYYLPNTKDVIKYEYYVE